MRQLREAAESFSAWEWGAAGGQRERVDFVGQRARHVAHRVRSDSVDQRECAERGQGEDGDSGDDSCERAADSGVEQNDPVLSAASRADGSLGRARDCAECGPGNCLSIRSSDLDANRFLPRAASSCTGRVRECVRLRLLRSVCSAALGPHVAVKFLPSSTNKRY